MDPNKLENLPRDVLFYFALEFDLPTVYNLCRTSKKLNQKLCQSDEFWSQRLLRDYQIRYQDIGGKSESKNILRLLGQYKTRRFISFVTGKKLKQKDIDEMLRDTAERGYLDVVEFLLEKGVDIHALDDAALRSASYFGRLEMVKYLLEKGANIHANDDEALIWASTQGHLDVVKYLLEQGADMNANDDAAIKGAIKHLEIVKYLLDQGADINAAMKGAIGNRHISVIKYLLDQGADINAAKKWTLNYPSNYMNNVLRYIIKYQKSHNK